LALGEATAESITKVAGALNGVGGKEAMKLELSQKYIGALSNLKTNQRVILSGNLTNMNEMLKAMDLDY